MLTVQHNWMAWCKRDVSDFFRWNFFSFKSAWIFSCAFQLSSTTFPCIFLAWFALCFWEKQRQNIEACTMNTTKQNKNISARKRYRRTFFYLIEKHMQKFRHFWRKKNFTWKSHLRPSCTKPFNYSTQSWWKLILLWLIIIIQLKVRISAIKENCQARLLTTLLWINYHMFSACKKAFFKNISLKYGVPLPLMCPWGSLLS